MRALYHWLLNDAPMWFSQLLIFMLVLGGVLLVTLLIMSLVAIGIFLFS